LVNTLNSQLQSLVFQPEQRTKNRVYMRLKCDRQMYVKNCHLNLNSTVHFEQSISEKVIIHIIYTS